MVFWTMQQSYKFMLTEILKIASLTTLEFNRNMSAKKQTKKQTKTLQLNNELLSNTWVQKRNHKDH